MTPVELYTKEERKSSGTFYTPNFLAEYLAKKALSYYDKSKKLTSIIDPACGDSILLRSLAAELPTNKMHKTPIFYGVDKDINAIVTSNAKFASNPLRNFTTRFIQTDGLFPFEKQNSREGWFNLKKEIGAKNGFDIALSNPPWGADITCYSSLRLNQNFLLAKGQFDVFDLFVEMTLNNLNEGGIYGFILPDSVFTQEQMGFRRLLSEKTTIHLIARLGEKIFPEINRACVVIIGAKLKAPDTHLVDCFRLTPNFKRRVMSNELTLEKVEKELSHKVPQQRFFQNENYIFDIDLKANEQGTFDKILVSNQCIGFFVTSTRGAEISKKGLVCQCNKCQHWMPFPMTKQFKCSNCKTELNVEDTSKEKIIFNHNGTGNIRLKVGEDLFRFTSTSKSYLNTLKKGINYKNLSIYSGDKILVRKTGVGITASIDYENSMTNQVVYILKLKSEFQKNLSMEFILAILNSRAMTYFLIKKYGESEWKTHPYLTQTMLENLPFPKIDFNSKENVKWIDRITKTVKAEVNGSKEKNISKQSDIFIERIVARFFNLNHKDYRAIFETLKSAEQLIPIKRLLNCTADEIFNVNGI